MVLADAAGEGAELVQAAGFGGGEPGVEVFRWPVSPVIMSQKLRMAAWSCRRWGQAAVTAARAAASSLVRLAGLVMSQVVILRADGMAGGAWAGRAAGQVAEGADQPADLLVTAGISAGR